MIDSSPWSSCETYVSFLIDVAARSTLLLIVACLLDRIAGPRRVLLRSSLWHATLGALVMLPLATLLMPSLSLPLTIRELESFDHLPTTAAVAPATWEHADRDYVDAAPLASTLPSAEGSAVNTGRLLVFGAIAGIHACVCASLIVRFALSLKAVRGLTATAEPIADDRWTTLLRFWRQRMGVQWQVRLLGSREVAVPVQIGWLRPAILLPPRVSEATDDQIRAAVVIHELGHVRRGDYAWNLLLRVLTAIYWPNPLVWFAARQICQVREQACDDLCIYWLGGSTVYRSRLVELAAELLSRRPIALLGIAMSHPAKLAIRLQWIDKSVGRPNCTQSVIVRRACIAMALLLSAVLGAVSVGTTAAEEQQPETAPQPKPADKSNSGDIPALPPGTSRPVLLPFDPNGTTPVVIAEEGDEEQNDEPNRVRVERIQRQDFLIEVSQPCTLNAGRISRVYARVPGFVKQMAVDIGDRVKKGDTIAELESLFLAPEYDQAESAVAENEAEQQQAAAAVIQAEANLAAAQADVKKAEADLEAVMALLKYREKQHERFKGLAEKGAVDATLIDEQEEKLASAKAALSGSKSTLESAKSIVRLREAALASAQTASKLAAARIRVALAKLAEAKQRSESVRIVSPMDGVVIERQAHVGDFVETQRNNLPLCTVADLRKMAAVTQIPERPALAMKRGMAARIFLDALPDKVLTAKISRVGYNIDAATRTLRVDLEIGDDNSDGRLLPGLYGAVALTIGVHQNVLSVPHRACHGSSVYTIVDGRAAPQQIEFGETSFDRVEVLSGLREEDLVITGLASPKQKQPDWQKKPRVEVVQPDNS